MNSIKLRCKNWIVCFKKFDSFHLIHLIVEKFDVFNFHPTFSIAITNFSPTCEIWTRFLKNIHQKWKYYRGRKKKLWKIMGSYKSCTHPHPPTSSQKTVTPTHTQSKKRSLPPTPSQKKDIPPKFSRKCREKKIFHYQLGNRICQKLKKSSIPTDQVHRSIDINIFWAETLAGGNFYGTDFRDWQI